MLLPSPGADDGERLAGVHPGPAAATCVEHAVA